MRKLTLLVVTACSAAALTATPASAALKSCTSNIPNTGNLKAKHVTCKRARRVMRKHFHGDSTPFGYTCTQKQFEAGVTTTCREGIKLVRYSFADYAYNPRHH